MDLRPISPGPEFRITCEKCHATFWSKGNFARIDGIPFQSYYCKDCAARLRYTTSDGETRYYEK